MGTLWLGGAEGLIARNFTFHKGFHKTFTSTPPLGHCPRDVIRPPENWKTPPLLDIHKHPPLDIVRVTSSALRKIEKHPPPTIAAAQKKDRRCPKNWVAQKLGGLQPPLPPRLIRLWPLPFTHKTDLHFLGNYNKKFIIIRSDYIYPHTLYTRYIQALNLRIST